MWGLAEQGTLGDGIFMYAICKRLISRETEKWFGKHAVQGAEHVYSGRYEFLAAILMLVLF